MSYEALLLVLLRLPFAGSIAQGIFPANARNSEALLAEAVALAGMGWRGRHIR
jgi:hypothetical protein